MRKLFLTLFFVFFCQTVFANELVNLYIDKKDEYNRVIFELTEKPIFAVKQLNNEKIEVDIKNINIVLPLHKMLDYDNEIQNIDLEEKNNTKIFIIKINKKSSLKRYLYVEAKEANGYYKLIVDINRKNLDFLLEDVAFHKEKSLNDIINEQTSFKFNNLDELLSYNMSDEDIKDLEKQNNDDADIDNLLAQLDIYAKEEKQEKKQERKQEKQQITAKQQKQTKQEQSITRDEKDKIIIVLDAGHGGHDSGAIGKRGLMEKDVNLAFVKTIKKELEKNPKIKVILTRQNDVFVPLSTRVIFSMRKNADLFISIHSDSNQNTRATGLSIYTLNERGFQRRTTKLIKQSNGTSNYLMNRNKLISKAKYNNQVMSSRFANTLVRHFDNNDVNMLNNPHKQANFAVLLSPNYPSVLIELGFLSNYNDEKMLSTISYRKTIAKAIGEAVNNFFNTY